MVIKEEDFPSATFEEKMTILLKMSDEEKKRSAEQIPYMCLCSKCPSYVKTAESKLAFCTLGKSEVIKEQKGCLCNQCPISKTMSMRWDHYCIRGDAMQLSDTEKG
ncbi:MAG: DUF2769 domain-containing protein [Candidatus Heimdallarchaeaceae archaeon]